MFWLNFSKYKYIFNKIKMMNLSSIGKSRYTLKGHLLFTYIESIDRSERTSLY